MTKKRYLKFLMFFKKTKPSNINPTFIDSDSSIVKVALLLPFYLDMNDTLKAYNVSTKLLHLSYIENSN